MEQLKVIGTEDDVLVLATETGERFSLPVDEALRAELRRARRERDTDVRGAKPSPREIQSHIRAGMSAQEVAALLDARLEDVVRFERPVLAEREHVVGQALAVPVLLGGDFDGNSHPTFGSAVRGKLAEAGATGERWTSWKEPGGWVVKLEFTANEIDHDARWGFDPRRGILSPTNSDAVQLSRQGSLPEGLIPRLRALDTAPSTKDDTRFDSGAFGPRRLPDADISISTPDLPSPATPAVQEAAIKRSSDTPATSAETADLLEALRRRRGQREPLPGAEETVDRSPSPVALFDALEPGYDDPQDVDPTDEGSAPAAVAESAGRRKGRSSMPSWDEIVFGARGDD